jgi:RNA polymerase sigma-70 factor (ECF subfamily)
MDRQRGLFSENLADQDLARRLKSGDARAMADLYDRFGAAVYAIALRMVREPGTAEDLVQETFIRIWNGIQLFDEEKGALGAWVAAVTRNRVLDHIRSLDWRMMQAACDLNRADRHPARDIGAWQTAAPDTASGDNSLQSPTLTKAVTSLADNHRRVLELAYLEGLSQSEIAIRIHRPVGTVKTWARGALKSLRMQISRPHNAGRLS